MFLVAPVILVLLHPGIAIYEKYLKGSLKRSDFEFKSGISFEEFIYEYFDRVSFHNGSLIAFFPKPLTDNGHLLHEDDKNEEIYAYQ